MEAIKHIDYEVRDIYISNIDQIPQSIQDMLLEESEKYGNKLPFESYTENDDGSFSITYLQRGEKGALIRHVIHVAADNHLVKDGGNSHNVIAGIQSWEKVAGILGENAGFTSNSIRRVPQARQRTGFWFPIKSKRGNIQRDICLGEPYDKKTVCDFTQGLGITSGRIYTDFFIDRMSDSIEQIVTPTSHGMKELKAAIAAGKNVFPCVNGAELDEIGVDTKLVDWKSDDSIIDFVKRVLPKSSQGKRYPKLTMLDSLHIGENALGVYALGTDRIVAINGLDFELSDKLTADIPGLLEEGTIKAGRGDVQVSGKYMAEGIHKHRHSGREDESVYEACAAGNKLSFVGAAIVHRMHQSNPPGYESVMGSSYTWANTRNNDTSEDRKLPIRFLRFQG